VSRIVVFDLANRSQGEFSGVCNRGWMVNGSYSTSGGGQTSIAIPDSVAGQPWMQIGRMVYVDHPKLPAWAGMIDTPWESTLPASVSIYNMEYLLSLRTPDEQVELDGTTIDIAGQMLEMANEQEEMYLRLGEISGDSERRVETLDQRTFWEQLNALAARSGLEMVLRPVRESDHLVIYVDMLDQAGEVDQFELHDGANANMQIQSAKLDGTIVNRVIGISSQSTASSRITTEPQTIDDSIDTYRLRSSVAQFQGVTEDSTLLANTQAVLSASAWPRLIIQANILDVGDTFAHLAPGNTINVHASRLFLPGGVRAWRGQMRMMALAYDEGQNSVGITMETQYNG